MIVCICWYCFIYFCVFRSFCTVHVVCVLIILLVLLVVYSLLECFNCSVHIQYAAAAIETRSGRNAFSPCVLYLLLELVCMYVR